MHNENAVTVTMPKTVTLIASGFGLKPFRKQAELMQHVLDPWRLDVFQDIEHLDSAQLDGWAEEFVGT